MKIRPKRKGITSGFSLQLAGMRHFSIFFFLIGLFLFLFASVNQNTLSSARLVAMDVVAPVLAAVNKPISDTALLIRDISGLAAIQQENAGLRAENMKLREWYQKAAVLEVENKRLQTLLNVNLPENSRFVTARIIADSGSSFLHSLLVGAGTAQNVTSGNAVISHDGLIGRVIESGRNVSRVLLLTDINARVPVLVLGANQRGLLAGQNSEYPELIHLPGDVDLADGSKVVTSGHGGLFPYGLAVGTTAKQADGSYRVVLSADVDRAQYVKIVDNPAVERLP